MVPCKPLPGAWVYTPIGLKHRLLPATCGISINDGELLAFEKRPQGANRVVNVELRGRGGNPEAVEARVTLTLDDGSSQTAEVAAGGGYLSQSPSILTFGLGSSQMIKSIAVRWPDGAQSEHQADRAEVMVEISQP